MTEVSWAKVGSCPNMQQISDENVSWPAQLLSILLLAHSAGSCTSVPVEDWIAITYQE